MVDLARLDRTLVRGRAAARARMVDTFEIKIVTGGKPVYDPGTKTTGPAYTTLFSTPGYVPPAGGSVLTREAEVGGRTSLSSRREIRIPWDADAVPANAVAVCTAIGTRTPPRMLGKTYRVGGSDGVSQGTACHLEIIEVLT